jgi:hypothetical protein
MAVSVRREYVDARSQPDPRVGGNRDQTARPYTRLTTAVNAVGPSIKMRRPSDRVMSTRLADGGADEGAIGMSIDSGSTATSASISIGRNVASCVSVL